MSVHFWINPSHVKQCTDLGFNVKSGKGKDRFFIESRENPLDPTADIRRIPTQAIYEITVRMTVTTDAEPGLYALGIEGRETASMRIENCMVKKRVQQGLFTQETLVPAANGHQDVRIAAQSISQVIRIFRAADGGQIQPDSNLPADLVHKFD